MGRQPSLLRCTDQMCCCQMTSFTPKLATTVVPAGVSGAPCPDGSSVESGLQANTVKLYRAVCAAFPAVSSWGGRSGSGDHGAGLALDIMCTGSLGDAIASYVRSHASSFGVSEVIWQQHIDRKSTRLNSSHCLVSRMLSSAW